MLIDVEFRRPDYGTAVVLTIIGGGQLIPSRIGQGMYLSGHWSIDQLGVPIKEWSEEKAWGKEVPEFGVCDSPDQLVSLYDLRSRPERMFVSFVRVRREDQPLDGGWRWNKWGPYVGTQKPTAEYLHDEPLIKEVYTFHIYEIKED